jgi:hypothetical protein
MSFQLKNKETGHIYTINEIDEMAAKFWGVEVSPKYYAEPKGYSQNWFDMIGWSIDQIDCKSLNKNNLSMPEIASFMMYQQSRFSNEINVDHFIKWSNWLKPYFELCEHFKQLNIIGVQL